MITDLFLNESQTAILLGLVAIAAIGVAARKVPEPAGLVLLAIGVVCGAGAAAVQFL